MAAQFDIKIIKAKVVLPSGKTLFVVPELFIPHGTHVLIRGESGRGKTTLLHLMAGLFAPHEGFVYIGDQKLNSLSDDHLCDLRRAHIGVIFQKLNLIDHLTVEENVRLGLPDADSDGIKVRHAIDTVQLNGRYEDRCSYLSLGEQQRVAVARVLASKPEILLADEPTSSLDEKNSHFVIEALKQAAKGQTLVVVSHDHRISGSFDQVIEFGELVQ